MKKAITLKCALVSLLEDVTNESDDLKKQGRLKEAENLKVQLFIFDEWFFFYINS